jgi:hypothetical protein
MKGLLFARHPKRSGQASESASKEAIKDSNMGAAIAQCPIIGVANAKVREPHARRASAVRTQHVQALAAGRVPGAVWRYN